MIKDWMDGKAKKGKKEREEKERREKKKEEGNKSHRNKLSLFVQDMVVYMENPKESIKNLPELITEFNKVSGYIINTQTILVLYSNNKNAEKKIKNTI